VSKPTTLELISGVSAALQECGVALICDATDASSWKGDSDKRFDAFVELGAEMPGRKCQQAFGAGNAVLIGVNDGAHWFAGPDGLVLVNFSYHGEGKLPAKVRATLTDWASSDKTKGKPKTLGLVDVPSGVLAVVPLSEKGATPPASKAASGQPSAAITVKQTLFLPAAHHRYEVVLERIEKELSDGYLESRVRLQSVRAT
jgi:hypothetical protein